MSDPRYVIKVQSVLTSEQIPINSTHYQFSGLQSGSKYNFGVNVVDSKTRQQSSLTRITVITLPGINSFEMKK